jgi:hypothetical protein
MIGQAIATSKEEKFGIDEFNLGPDTKITFDQERGAFNIIVNKGKSGQYTEGGEYSYNYSSAPYVGYFNIDSNDKIWSGAFLKNDSVLLRNMTNEEIENYNANNDN